MPADSRPLPRLSFTYDEWIRNTSRTLRIRSAKLKALDILIDTYIRVPTPNNLMYLRRQFESWKAGEDKEVKALRENEAMINGTAEQKAAEENRIAGEKTKREAVYDSWRSSSRNTKADAFTKLNADLNRLGDTDMAYGQRDSMSESMNDARLGLLYLFSNLNCTQYFEVATSGIIDLTTASIGFANDQLKNDVLGKVNTALTEGKSTIVDQSKQFDQWLARRKEQRRIANSNQLLSAPPATSPANRGARDEVSASLQEAARKIAKSIDLSDLKLNEHVEPEKSKAQTAWEGAPGKLRMLCDFLGDKYLSNAMPFVSGGLATVGGLIKTVEAGVVRYQEYSLSKYVGILPGTPSTIANEIRRAMDINICAGMYTALKGGGQLAVEGVTAGAASPISSLAFSLVEALVSTTWKIHDLVRMERFFDEAARQYAIHKQDNALHTRPIAFNAWYRSYALGTPAISALALVSGICGDKMRFLKMYTAANEAISASSFDAGVADIDKLKGWSASYLAEVGYKFTSDDPLTTGLLNPVHPRPDTSGSFQKLIVAPIKGFIG